MFPGDPPHRGSPTKAHGGLSCGSQRGLCTLSISHAWGLEALGCLSLGPGGRSGEGAAHGRVRDWGAPLSCPHHTTEVGNPLSHSKGLCITQKQMNGESSPRAQPRSTTLPHLQRRLPCQTEQGAFPGSSCFWVAALAVSPGAGSTRSGTGTDRPAVGRADPAASPGPLRLSCVLASRMFQRILGPLWDPGPGDVSTFASTMGTVNGAAVQAPAKPSIHSHPPGKSKVDSTDADRANPIKEQGGYSYAEIEECS